MFSSTLNDQLQEEREKEKERRKRERQQQMNKSRNLESIVKDAQRRGAEFERKVTTNVLS